LPRDNLSSVLPFKDADIQLSALPKDTTNKRLDFIYHTFMLNIKQEQSYKRTEILCPNHKT